MKKLFVFACILVLCANLVFATIKVSYQCEDDICVEGSLMNWSISILNNLNKSITIGQVFVVDVDTSQLIALHNDKKVIVAPGEFGTFNFQNIITAPMNGGYSFQFKPCFNISINEGSGLVCKSSDETLSVIPLSKIQCFKDSDCDSNEFCFEDTLKCKVLSCKPGEVVSDHQCMLPNCAWYQENSNSGCSPNILLLFFALLIIFGIITFIITSRIKPANKNNKRKKKKRS